MSGPRYSIIPAAAVTDWRLPDNAVRVLALVGSYTDRNGWCSVKQDTLAAKLGVSRPLVSKCLKALAECGYIERTRERVQI